MIYYYEKFVYNLAYVCLFNQRAKNNYKNNKLRTAVSTVREYEKNK